MSKVCIEAVHSVTLNTNAIDRVMVDHYQTTNDEARWDKLAWENQCMPVSWKAQATWLNPGLGETCESTCPRRICFRICLFNSFIVLTNDCERGIEGRTARTRAWQLAAKKMILMSFPSFYSCGTFLWMVSWPGLHVVILLDVLHHFVMTLLTYRSSCQQKKKTFDLIHTHLKKRW